MERNQILELAQALEKNLPSATATPYRLDGSLAKFIDHTLLKPEATPHQVEVLCSEAREYRFASVCVNPIFVPLCRELLDGSGVDVCTVVGFPLGADPGAVKAAEAKDAIHHGAVEIDMVQSVGMLKGGAFEVVYDDIRAVAEACHEERAILKVILETCLLTESEKIIACLLCKEAGADFVKTSTGFNKAGATVEDIRLMRAVVGPTMGVKAAGGVRCLADARAMLEAGATRLGASAGVAIMQEIVEA
ncbi:MAG: deoxyribose-phosphate aldolase [Anaerolineae bacterium]|nr:deoxyribose-phosphate aldolase [Anaerolineae bacterium]